MKIVELGEIEFKRIQLMHVSVLPAPAFYSPISNTIYVFKDLPTEAKKGILREEYFHASHHRFPLLLSVISLSCPVLSFVPRLLLSFFIEWDAYRHLFGAMPFLVFSKLMVKLMTKGAVIPH